MKDEDSDIISFVDCFIFKSLFWIPFLSCLLFGDVTIPLTSWALIDWRNSSISFGDLAKFNPLFMVYGLNPLPMVYGLVGGSVRSYSTILFFSNPIYGPTAKYCSCYILIIFYLWSSMFIPFSDETENWPLSTPFAGIPPSASSSYSFKLTSEELIEISLSF